MYTRKVYLILSFATLTLSVAAIPKSGGAGLLISETNNPNDVALLDFGLNSARGDAANLDDGKVSVAEVIEADTADIFSDQTEPVCGVVCGQDHTYPVIGVKTNMLYYLALMPNLEVEYYFSSRWSINAEYQIAWWRFRRDDKFYQIQMGGPELRYWLRPNGEFSGSYFGLYGSAGIYDLKWGQTGYRSNSFWSVGASWGYVMPIREKLFLELGVGIGYVYTQYDEYGRNYPLGEHYDYLRTRQTSYFGPTKLKVGLVWRIGKSGRGE